MVIICDLISTVIVRFFIVFKPIELRNQLSNKNKFKPSWYKIVHIWHAKLVICGEGFKSIKFATIWVNSQEAPNESLH